MYIYNKIKNKINVSIFHKIKNTYPVLQKIVKYNNMIKIHRQQLELKVEKSQSYLKL